MEPDYHQNFHWNQGIEPDLQNCRSDQTETANEAKAVESEIFENCPLDETELVTEGTVSLNPVPLKVATVEALTVARRLPDQTGGISAVLRRMMNTI
jgi:hypothetical protein